MVKDQWSPESIARVDHGEGLWRPLQARDGDSHRAAECENNNRFYDQLKKVSGNISQTVFHTGTYSCSPSVISLYVVSLVQHFHD